MTFEQSFEKMVSLDDASLTSSSSSSFSSQSEYQLCFQESRSSSVTFSDTAEVVTVECIEANQHNREEIWYSAEELREMKEEYYRLEKDKRNNEPRVSSSSPRSSRSCTRKESRYIVLCEHANQILEYGYIWDTERLALEYKRASEQSKILALARGHFNAAACHNKTITKKDSVANGT